MRMVFNMAGGPPLPLLTSPGTAGDLRAGKQLIDNNGDVLNGTLPEVEQATPTISVSAGGLITATVEQTGGIVPAGSKSATDQLPTQAANTITPGTANQTAVPAGVYTTGDVTVAGDANLVPENIAEGVSIFGVTGTMSGGPEVIPIDNCKINSGYKCQVWACLGTELIYWWAEDSWPSELTGINKGSIIVCYPSKPSFSSSIVSLETSGSIEEITNPYSNYDSEYSAFFVTGPFVIDFNLS